MPPSDERTDGRTSINFRVDPVVLSRALEASRAIEYPPPPSSYGDKRREGNRGPTQQDTFEAALRFYAAHTEARSPEVLGLYRAGREDARWSGDEWEKYEPPGPKEVKELAADRVVAWLTDRVEICSAAEVAQGSGVIAATQTLRALEARGVVTMHPKAVRAGNGRMIKGWSLAQS